MWNTRNGGLIKEFKELSEQSFCRYLSFNHDNTYLAIGFDDRIIIWNLALDDWLF